MKLEKTAIDFFAGIGLVSYALQNQGWNILYAVDHSPEKKDIYENHFGNGHYHLSDVKKVTGSEIPRATLAHASFPCTDTSVAGSRGGITTGESSTFWEFARILFEMDKIENIGLPPLVLVENVEGLLTSGSGQDIIDILTILNELGYAVDILLIDAARFIPQSRVRLFIVGNSISPESYNEKQDLCKKLDLSSDVRPQKIKDFICSHPEIRWHIHNLPDLPELSVSLESIVDENEKWWNRERADYLYNQMFDRHKQIVQRMMQNNYWSYGTVFRRMRKRDGRKQSTAELRTDGIAGCLRTPKGGSARQILLRAGYGKFDARLLNAVENAKLMGAENFDLPSGLSLNDALFGFGDAVAVPVIEWIEEHYLHPLVMRFNEEQEKVVDDRTPQQRSATMAAVKSKGTHLEKLFFQELTTRGISGMETHPDDIFGKPDMIHREAKIALFIDSCFWHGCSKHLRMPSSNRDYWEAKITKNRKRDKEVTTTLSSNGWKVIRIWEHSLKKQRSKNWWLTRIKNIINDKLEIS